MCFDLSNYSAGCGWGWVGEVVAGEWFKVMVVVGGSFVASGCPLCDGGDLRESHKCLFLLQVNTITLNGPNCYCGWRRIPEIS